MNVGVDFNRPFLVDEMRSVSYNDHFFQTRYILFEGVAVDVVLSSWKMVSQIQIPHDELHWYLYFCLCPWRCQLPSPVISNSKQHIYSFIIPTVRDYKKIMQKDCYRSKAR